MTGNLLEHTMKKIIIGVIGRKLSGKGTFGECVREMLPKHNVVLMSFSDVLFDTLLLWDLERSRHHLQRLAIIMNQEFGEGTLTHAVQKRLGKADADIVIVDGVRWLSDRDMLRLLPDTLLVYVAANAKTRYARRSSGGKFGEATVSYRKFLRQEKVLTEQYIEEMGRSADYTIKNNGTIEAFRDAVKTFCTDYLLPLF